MPEYRILVCDDEAAARRGIVRALGSERFSFIECGSGNECLQQLDSGVRVHLILLDLRMPGLDGHATLERIGEMTSPPPVVVVTADSQLRTAVDAIRGGASDFLAKPYDLEELRWVVERTLSGDQLKRENRRLKREVRRLGGEPRLLGESPAMQRLLSDLERIASSDAGVLIRGETGSGKEVVARQLHASSRRVAGAFVAVNCAAVPEGLLESELFGHRKGAFTGADRDRVGRFLEADGGTLFLDEIGDMPPAAQAKMLRVLQERLVEPVGGGASKTVDVRVLAATHRDLEAACAEGDFRQDLYYRLKVVEVQLPPLRDRGRDILLLAKSFLELASITDPQISPEASQALLNHPWPGNVRELKNAMERAAIFCTSQVIHISDLPSEVRHIEAGPSPQAGSGTDVANEDWTDVEFRQAKSAVLENFERRFLTTLLERHQGNVSRAAREAGLHRQNLQKKMRTLGLEAHDFRQPQPSDHDDHG